MSVEAMKKALDVLEWHASRYCEESIPEDTVEAATELREAIAAAEKAEPVAHFGSAYINHNGLHITTVLGPVAIPQDAKLYAVPPDTAAMLAEKDTLLWWALEALEGFANITNDSQGVAGYHLSGDTAEWGEFPEVYHADKAIEAIRNHLGVKND